MNNPYPLEKNVNFVAQGQGAPVILIHGLAASLLDWTELLPALQSAGYCGYALDLLGHGESYKPAELSDYQMDIVFEHFSAWLEMLARPEPLILVGHSLGAALALEYALRRPERVRALVLGNPFYSLEQLPPLLRYSNRSPLISARMVDRTPQWVFRLVIDLTSLSIRNGFQLPEKVRGQTALDYKRAHPGIFNLLASMRDLTSDLARLQVPCLVIAGSHDQTLAPASFTRLARILPDARLVALPAGHVPHQSHPQEFNRQVLEFLKTLQP